jgi:hypothetical protein
MRKPRVAETRSLATHSPRLDRSSLGQGRTIVLKLQADITSEAERDQPDAGLRGEKLTEVSAVEEGRWPPGLRALSVLGLGALA